MTQLWGQPIVSEQQKNVRNEEQEIERNTKRTRTSSPVREQDQNKSTTVEEVIECDDWNTRFIEYRKEILREQEEKAERLVVKEKKEQSWELYRLCKNFLENNSEDWRKRKEQRENEKNRVLRLEKAGILSRKAKLEAIERNVKLGMERIPPAEKEKIVQLL